MDTDEYDLLDLKMVCSLLESGTTDENLEETLSSLRERHSDRLRNKMAAKFRIDGSSLARDDFADAGADLDRFIRFAQTCQIFSQKNFS